MMWKKSSNRKGNTDQKPLTGSMSKTFRTKNPSSKHLVYFMHIMAEQRVTRYLAVAEDATAILKVSIEQICNCIGLWKGDIYEDEQFGKEFAEDVMTQFGLKIFRIGKLLGAIQNNDPITFWTNGEKELIIKMIIPMAKDAVKLRRKLTRMSDGMIVDLKKLRRLVDIYGRSTAEKNTTVDGSDIMEEFGEGSVSEFGYNTISKTEVITCSTSIGYMLHFLRSIFMNKPSETGKESQSKQQSKFSEVSNNLYEIEENYSTASMKTQFSFTSMELQTPSQRPSEKQLKKIASALTTSIDLVPMDYILDPLESKIRGVDEPFLELEKLKLMDVHLAIPTDNPHEDVVSPSTVTEINKKKSDDVVEEKVKSSLSMKNNTESLQPSLSVQNDTGGGPSKITPNIQEWQKPIIKNDAEYDRQKYLKKIESGNQNETFDDPEKTKLEDDLVEFEKQLHFIGIPIPKALGETELPFMYNIDRLDTLEEIDTVVIVDSIHNQFNSKEYLSVYRSTVNEMHDSVLAILNQIRSVEETWLTTGKRPRMGSDLPRLGDLFRYVRRTVELTNQPDFDEQLYPEIKNHIFLAVETVYREAHSCFIALGELTQVVSTDVSYLKELLKNFPKGDLIVYEYSSNSSLNSFDQIESAVIDSGNFTVDLDVIFG